MTQLPANARRRNNGHGERVPPHDLRAEESLLGAALLSPSAVAAAVDAQLSPEDFYKPLHGSIFEAATALYARGEPVDPTTVADEMRRCGLVPPDPPVLSSLQAITPAIGNAGRYARIVGDLALSRRMMAVGRAIADLGLSGPADMAEALGEAEALVLSLGTAQDSEGPSPLSRLLGEQLDRIEALYERGETVTGIPTGFLDLDALLLGLQPGSLVVVGARPSVGKTAFACNIAVHAALAGHGSLLFSLEMSAGEMVGRMLTSESRINSEHLRTGRLESNDWPKLSKATGRLAEAPIWIDDSPSLSLLDLKSRVRRAVDRHQVRLVIVDYLQLMAGRARAENRQVEVAEIARGLKTLAREANVPVVALSQLSRNLESRSDKRPTLADLRETGELEQAADAVIFLYRDEVYNRDSPDRGTAEVIVAKHRNGPTGVVRLAFLDHYTRFANMAKL